MEWIPLDKDHLPEDGQLCLVTVWTKDFYAGSKKIIYHLDIAKFLKERGYLKVEGGYFNTYEDWDDWNEKECCGISAWMPAPKPYGEATMPIKHDGQHYVLSPLNFSLSGWAGICELFGLDPCKVIQINLDISNVEVFTLKELDSQ